MHIIQTPLFDFEAFIAKKGNDRLVMALEALPAEGLLSALEKARWTGRKGYSVRGMWSALIAGVLRQAHSLADVVRLLERDKDTRLVCGFSEDNVPSHDALSRFLKKLAELWILMTWPGKRAASPFTRGQPMPQKRPKPPRTTPDSDIPG